MYFPEYLGQHIPENSLQLLRAMWKKHPFVLKVSKARQTKAGDYRYIPQAPFHYISVNGNLNPYQFLFVLIHEMAHQWIKIKYKRRQAPHGNSWKNMFKNLLSPYLSMQCFPAELESMIALHMKNPKATTTADAQLIKAFRKFDIHIPEGKIHLESLEEGTYFMIGNKTFEKGPLRRTRFLCREIPGERKYTVSSTALVELVSNA